MSLSKPKRRQKSRKPSQSQIQYKRVISYEDLESLQKILKDKQRQEKKQDSIEMIISILEKNKMNFLLEMRQIVPNYDFENLVLQMKMATRERKQKIINYHYRTKNVYILLDGEAVYQFHDKQKPEKEKMKIDEVKKGELLFYSPFETINSGKNYYEVRCLTRCIFLQFKDLKSIKLIGKYLEKKYVEISKFLKKTSIFNEISEQKLLEHSPFFIQRQYLKSEGIKREQNFLYVIIEGQVELSKSLKFGQTKTMIKIATIGQKETFLGNEVNKEENVLKIVGKSLKVLKLNIRIFEKISLVHEEIDQNIKKIEEKKKENHYSLYQKNSKTIMKNQRIKYRQPQVKSGKGKKLQKKRNKRSFQWWALTGNITKSEKYKMPTFYQSQKKQKSTISFEIRIDDLKSKLLRKQLKSIELYTKEKEIESVRKTYTHSQLKKVNPIKLKTPQSIYKKEREKQNSYKLNLKVREKLYKYLRCESIEEKPYF